MRVIKLILLISLAITACNSSKDYTYSKKELDPRIVANFCYRPGSYWIYKDSATGETGELQITDTIRTTYRSEVYYHITEMDAIYCSGRIVHPVSGGADTTILRLDLINSGVAIYYSGGLVNKALLSSPFYVYPVKTSPEYLDGSLTSDFIPSMTVNGHVYNNVLYSTSRDRDEYWVTETEGIIRMHLRHPYETVPDRVYELDHYHIER